MPESKRRVPKRSTTEVREAKKLQPSPRWWAPTMVTLMVLGLIWVVIYYIAQGEYPVKALGYWNLLVGFAVIMVGFLMTTRWR